MYVIDYRNNNFIVDIKFEERVDKDTFSEFSNYLLYHFIRYNSKFNGWAIDKKKIDERVKISTG